jgi:phage terminase large subunit-like protein
MIEGPSGLLTISPKHNRPNFEPSKRRVTWANGATAYSADEPDRLRGPTLDFIWTELAAWNDPSALDQAMFGLRMAKNPHVVVTTTPRPTLIVRGLIAREGLPEGRPLKMPPIWRQRFIFSQDSTNSRGKIRA